MRPRLRGVTVAVAAALAVTLETGCPSGGPVGSCAALSACCSQAGAANETTCDDTLSAGIDSICASELTNLSVNGSCGGDAGGGGTGSCAALAACCVGMSSLNAAECQRTVMLGNVTSCGQQLTSYQTGGACNGGSATSSAGSTVTRSSSSSRGGAGGATSSGRGTGAADAAASATGTGSTSGTGS